MSDISAKDESQDEFADKSKIMKRKHITLTIEEKLRIIALVEDGGSRQTIASQFGIGKSTVHDIHKRRDKIREFAISKSSNDICKRRRVDTNVRNNFKEEIAEEELTESIESFDYQEINEHGYEIVYESGCPIPVVSNTIIDDKPVIESKPEPKPKRKSRTLTFREKYEAINMISNGSPVPHVCEQFGIGRTTVYDIMRKKQEIEDFVEKSNCDERLNRRTFKKSKFPEVEERVVAWCDSRINYTKHEFYDYAKATFENCKESGAASIPSGFCGSWSWSKRFFSRHPNLKQKLVKDSGEPEEDDIDMSRITEYLEDSTFEEKFKPVHVKDNWIKCLTHSEKLQVLKKIDAGKRIEDIAEFYQVPKTTICEIFKRRNELRNTTSNKSVHLGRTARHPKYPQLELELLQWCLNQKNFPLTNVLIAEKASCLFDTLELKGNFNPSYQWAKKFVQRYPEICTKQEFKSEADTQEENIVEQEIEEESTAIEEEESFDDMETFVFPNDYEEEYIVEELDQQLYETDNVETVEAIEAIKIEEDEEESHEIVENHSDDRKNGFIISSDDIVHVPDAIALKSLKILIKYSEQQGHTDILSHLIDYQNQLNFDSS